MTVEPCTQAYVASISIGQYFGITIFRSRRERAVRGPVVRGHELSGDGSQLGDEKQGVTENRDLPDGLG